MYSFFRWLGALLFAGLMSSALLGLPASAEPLKVVSSFSILSDLMQQVGGEQVNVSTLVKADSDAHAYEPTAQDARVLSQAQILFVNGLGFEPWLERLKNASGFKGIEVVASNGITPRELDHAHSEPHHHSHAGHEHHGEADPHAWQNVQNAMIYVRNIEAALVSADPSHAAYYRQRAQAYIKELEELDAQMRAQLGSLPAPRRVLVTSHGAFGYLADAYGLALHSPMGLSTEAEPSAADIARLITQIRALKVPAVFLENISNPRLIERIAQETRTPIGGKLYSDALSQAGTPAGTYIGMMQANLQTIMKVLHLPQ